MAADMNRRGVLQGATAACALGMLPAAQPARAGVAPGLSLPLAEDVITLSVTPRLVGELRRGAVEVLGPAGDFIAWAFDPTSTAAGTQCKVPVVRGRVHLRLSADDGAGEQTHTVWLHARPGAQRVSLLPRQSGRALRARQGRPDGPHVEISLGTRD